MSHYKDFYIAEKNHAFVSKWVPEDTDKLPELTTDNYVWALAHWRAAESELKEIKAALETLKGALR